mmetsp:Transcript_35878/g.66553  ORF Transcript_35878/g.66553 Transcript_35878/m.66553 type:complete len:254 (-) Transcript_35878:1612-2373(-)
MNLAMRIRRNVTLRQILWLHRNHRRLFLLGIDVLHQPLHQQIRPRESFLIWQESLQLRNVVLLDSQFLIVHYEQGSADASGVCVDAHLGLGNVPNDGHLGVDVDHSPQLPESVHELRRVAVYPHPITVHEDLTRGRLGNNAGQNVRQVLRGKFLQKLHHGNLGCSRRDVRHERHIFHETHCLPLGSFGGTDHAPVRVVQLARLGLLSGTREGGIGTSEMRKTGGVGKAVKHLGYPGFGSVALVSPISCGQTVL